MFLQLLQAAVQQAGDGARRAAEVLANLRQCPAVPVLEDDGLARVGGQSLQRRSQPEYLFVALRPLARRRLLRDQPRLQLR